jgi:hypothetical protein
VDEKRKMLKRAERSKDGRAGELNEGKYDG